MKKKWKIGIILIIAIMLIPIFRFVVINIKNIKIDETGLLGITRGNCIIISKSAENHVKKKYSINVKVDSIYVGMEYWPLINNDPRISPANSAKPVRIRFKNNEFVSCLEGSIGGNGSFGIGSIERMYAKFHTKYRNDCIEFSQKIEECIERKYNKKLTVDNIKPNDYSSGLSYSVDFIDGSSVVISSNSNKLFDLDSLDLDNFELKEQSN